VVDAAERVLGYSLLVRPTASQPPTPPRDGAEELALLVDVLNRFGVEQSLTDKLGFLKLSSGCLASELMDLLPRERFVIEISAPPAEAAHAGAAQGAARPGPALCLPLPR
jgi:c-di-GMP-related signal transduction protein